MNVPEIESNCNFRLCDEDDITEIFRVISSADHLNEDYKQRFSTEEVKLMFFVCLMSFLFLSID
jgi:hypothetical protein